MEKLIGPGGRPSVWIVEIPVSGAFDSPVAPAEFSLLLADFAKALPEGAMRKAAGAMVAQGCRYAVCAGRRCRDWEAAFDAADLEANPDLEDDRFVTTTSHPDEPLEDVAEFLLFNTVMQGKGRFIVAIVGGRPADVRRVEGVFSRLLKGAGPP